MNKDNDALQNILGSLLSDPSAREGIGRVMDMLSGTGAPESVKAEESPAKPSGEGGGLPDLFGSNAFPVGNNDMGVNLLSALAPYLRPSRAKRMNTVIRLMQLSKVAPLLGSDLFMPKDDLR